MNDEQIIQYLRNRHRGNFDPPLGAVSTVMVAVDRVPSHSSRFTSFAAVTAAAAVVGAAVVVAFAIGVGWNTGPAPGASEEPSVIASSTPASALPSPGPTDWDRPVLSLLQPGDAVSLPAIDRRGEWGTIRLERGDELGGYRDAEIPPDTFVIEVFVTYRAERMPDPAQFGASDWAVRPSDPAADAFFVREAEYWERTSGIGLRPAMSLGEYPGAVDIFSTPTEGRIAFAIPRRAAHLSLELVYQLGGREQVLALRDPGPPPETVAVATPQPTSEAAVAEAAAMAEALFAQPDECANPTDGYTLTFPDAWYTNTATGEVPACSWFTPEFFEVTAPGVPPEEIWVVVTVVDGVVGYTSLTEIFLYEQVQIGGRPASRVEYNPNVMADPDYRGYQYVVPLGENGPTLAAGTDTDRADSYLLARAVLDRIMASFEFTR